MAIISLRAYNHEIEGLIDNGQLDEAVAHCRHILATFPKHIASYRLLGKAHLEQQRISDATDIFQRVLTAIPDDFISNVGMSIIREDENNLDAAIWHMELAYEAQPANAAIQDELRRLYGRRDGMQPPKARLTSGALARMYAKGGLYDQAIAELRTAISEDPNRPDLQLLLAQMLFQTSQRVEAVETCVSILKKLPLCLEANRILAISLPQTEGSDRIRNYRQIVISMDPYYAFAESDAISSDTVPENAVIIERLDWKSGIQVPETPSQPTWATSLGISMGKPTDENMPEWLKSAEAPAPTPPVEQATPGVSPFIWDTQEVEKIITDASKPEGEIPDWMKDAGWTPASGEVTPSTEEIKPGELNASARIDEKLEKADLPDWLRGIAPEGVIGEEKPEALSEEDQISNPWLEPHQPGPTDSIIHWLEEQKPGSPSKKDEVSTISPAEEVPDWLKDLDVPQSSTGQEQQSVESTPAFSTELPFFTEEPLAAETAELKAESAPDQKPVEPHEELTPASTEGMIIPEFTETKETPPVSMEEIPDWLLDLATEAPSSVETEAKPGEVIEQKSPLTETVLPSEQPLTPETPLVEEPVVTAEIPPQEPSEVPPAVPEIELPAIMEEQLAGEKLSISEEAPSEVSSTVEINPEVAIPSISELQPLVEVPPVVEVTPTEVTPVAVAESPGVSTPEVPEGQLPVEVPTVVEAAPAEVSPAAAEVSAEEAVPAVAEEQPSVEMPPVTEEVPVEVPSAPVEIPPVVAVPSAVEEPQITLVPPVSEEALVQAPAEAAEVLPEVVAPVISEELPSIHVPSFAEGESITAPPGPVAEVPAIETPPLATAEPQAEQPIPEESKAVTSEPGVMSEEEALAWLEGLAAEQKIKTEELVTPPEEGEITPPEWVKLEIEPATEEPIALEAKGVQEAPTVPAEEVPEWIKGLGEEPEAGQTAVEPAPAVPGDLELPASGELPAWLLELEQPEPEAGTTAATEEVLEWKPDELPDWLKEITETEEVPTAPPTAPTEVIPVPLTEPAVEQAEEVVPTVEVSKQALEEPQPEVETKAPVTEVPLAPEQEVTIQPEPVSIPVIEEVITPEVAITPAEASAIEPAEMVTEGEETLLTNARNAINLGQPPQAIKFYSELIRQDKRLDEIIKDLREVLYKFPVDIEIWVTLGDACYRIDNLQEALNAYTKAEELVR